MRASASDSVGNSQSAPAKKSQMPSLSGLRALSIVLVLLGHLSGTKGFPRLNLGIGDYAHLGVVVFFVISGFLITSLLISEYANKGRVSSSSFIRGGRCASFPHRTPIFLASGSCRWLEFSTWKQRISGTP